jgi:HAD superfamily hydrolase (TIGR01459 family)
MQSAIPILSKLSDLPHRSDAWLCDIWGVLHNGHKAFADAVEACMRFRRAGGIVVLVSNAPRPNTVVGKQLQSNYGITNDAYDAIISSGDVARQMLIETHLSARMLHIGPERDFGIFDDLKMSLVDAAKADLILCSGLYDDATETAETYQAMFAALLERRVPMLCANPDVKVERGEQIVWCAGALAALYAEMGGEVIYAGKPHAPVYAVASATIDKLAGMPIARERILAIGDGINTDIKGAAAAGIPSLFVASAIHVDGALTASKLKGLFDPLPFRPLAAMNALVL